MFDDFFAFIFVHTHKLPLEIIALFGPFLEELLPPLPMLPIMVLMGMFARVQAYDFVSIGFILTIAVTSRTAGAFLVYTVTDKLEDVFMKYLGSYFGLKPETLISLGERLSAYRGSLFMLIFFRALPFVPSTLISVVAGLLKLPLKLFLLSTFIGTIIRDSLYLYIGYSGVKIFRQVHERVADVQITIKGLFIFLLITTLIYLYYCHAKNNTNEEMS